MKHLCSSVSICGLLAVSVLVAGCDPIVIRWGAPSGPVPAEERAFAKVEREYLRHIEANPRDPAAPAELAERYRQRGNFARAEELFRKALDLSPRFYFARSGLARLFLETGRAKEAAAEAEKAAADNPGDAAAFALLARARRSNSDAAGERKALDDGLKLDPESVELLLDKAHLELGERNPAEAERLCRRAVKAAPENAAARADLAMALAETSTLNPPPSTGDPLVEALASAEAAVRLDDSSPAIWEVTGHVRELSRDSSGAEAAWRRALELDPDRLVARERLAGLLQNLGRLGEAEDQYRELVSRAPGQRRALERLILLARARGALGAELDARLRLARAFPDDADAQLGAADALEHVNEPARALEYWERLRALRPGNVEAHRALARLWTRLGKAGTATFHYKAALEKDPADREALAGLAGMAFEERRLDEARDLYQRLVKADPDNAGARVFLGIVTAAGGDNAGAAAQFEAALRIDASIPAAHRELAAVLRKLDEPKRAGDEARRAVELAPHDAGGWALLGRIEKDAGRKKESLAAFSRAVEESSPPKAELLWTACDAASDAGDDGAAAGFCRRLLGLETERLAASRTLARLAASAGKPGEELYWLGAALSLAPPEDLRRRSDRRRFEELCRDERASAAALALYQADLDRDPHAFAALSGMGTVRRLRGDLREAAALYERWLAESPASRPAVAALSIIYAKQAQSLTVQKPSEGRRLREKALGAALRLVAVDPRSAPARLVLARAYGVTGDRRRQELALRAAVDLDPKNPMAHNNLGVVLAADDRLAESRGEFERAAELAPKAAWPFHNLAVLSGKALGDAEVARSYRKQVEALAAAGAEAPSDPEAYWEFIPEEER